MRRFIRNPVILFVLAAWVMVYWPIALLVPQRLLLEFINGMIASVSIGIVSIYVPGVWRVLRYRPYKIRGSDLLILGATISHFAISLLFAWSWVYYVLDKPNYMVEHILRGWIVYLFFIGSLLLLLAWDVEEEKHLLPPRAVVHVGIVVFFGLASVVTFIALFNH